MNSSKREVMHNQEYKARLRQIVANLLLILPIHIYFSNLVYSASVYFSSFLNFSGRELPWNLVSSWRLCSVGRLVAPVITTWHSRFWSLQHHLAVCPILQPCNLQEYKAKLWETPSTEDPRQEVAQQFRDKWNFPHCCRALNGTPTPCFRISSWMYFDVRLWSWHFAK